MKPGVVDSRDRVLGSGSMDRQDRTNSRKTIFSVTSCPEMPPSADPVLQVRTDAGVLGQRRKQSTRPFVSLPCVRYYKGKYYLVKGNFSFSIDKLVCIPFFV